MRLSSTIILSMTVGCVSSLSHADVTGFTNFGEWQDAVDQYSTIDFTGWEQGTTITDQYAHLGVNFTDGNDFIIHTAAFVKDGEGLHGSWIDLQATVVFDSPQLWFGVDHPGMAFLDVYSGANLIGTFEHVTGGTGKFTGIISSVPFDRIVIHRGGDSPPYIDDLHWGVPAPGAVGVFALALLCGGSRRRRK